MILLQEIITTATHRSFRGKMNAYDSDLAFGFEPVFLATKIDHPDFNHEIGAKVEACKILSHTISQIKSGNEFQDKAAQRTLVREHSCDPQNSLGSFSNGKWYQLPDNYDSDLAFGFEPKIKSRTYFNSEIPTKDEACKILSQPRAIPKLLESGNADNNSVPNLDELDVTTLGLDSSD